MGAADQQLQRAVAQDEFGRHADFAGPPVEGQGSDAQPIFLRRDELPRHARQIAPFAISRKEVTIAEYARFAKATGRRMADQSGLEPAQTPVRFVSWDDASAYARWAGNRDL